MIQRRKFSSMYYLLLNLIWFINPCSLSHLLWSFSVLLSLFTVLGSIGHLQEYFPAVSGQIAQDSRQGSFSLKFSYSSTKHVTAWWRLTGVVTHSSGRGAREPKGLLMPSTQQGRAVTSQSQRRPFTIPLPTLSSQAIFVSFMYSHLVFPDPES